MRDHLVFYVNGVRHQVRGPDAALTLSEYLRGRAALVGTKIACAEGDCGACSVLVGRPTADGRRFEYRPIDACIAFVFQMDRRHVITVEGLADGEPTAVQAAMVACHGSQCGFCTPGFVVALHGLVEERRLRGGGTLTDDELRLGLSGNLCRCTGYAQILDAGRACGTAAAAVDAPFDAARMLEDFTALGDGPVHVNPRGGHEQNGAPTNGRPPSPPPEVFLPGTLDELLSRRAERPESTLVAADLGVQRNHGRIAPSDILATCGVKELDRLEVVDGELVIGAAVNWSRIEAFARDRLPAYHAILTRFGSPQVRHAGTLAGNLANASPIADSIPFHYVARSTIELASASGVRDVPIEAFYLGYKRLDLRPGEVIARVRTPLPTAGVDVRLYKVSKRRDMDISTVTAAFWIETQADRIDAARVAVGGVGPTVLRLPRAEALLAGAPLSEETLRAAGRVARTEVTPISDVRGGADHRLQLVENLFAKCFHDLAASPDHPTEDAPCPR